MTELLEEAIHRLRQLPESMQDRAALPVQKQLCVCRWVDRRYFERNTLIYNKSSQK
jgi:hypothetical protein